MPASDSSHDSPAARPAPEACAGRRVLLVEDNLHNRRIFAGVLRHYGFAVVEAVDGVEALARVEEDPPDLVLMDLSLPRMDGWEATRRIRAMPGRDGLPIIALTAHAMAGDEERALEAGCTSYLAKPISPKKVVEAVKRHLGGR